MRAKKTLALKARYNGNSKVSLDFDNVQNLFPSEAAVADKDDTAVADKDDTAVADKEEPAESQPEESQAAQPEESQTAQNEQSEASASQPAATTQLDASSQESWVDYEISPSGSDPELSEAADVSSTEAASVASTSMEPQSRKAQKSRKAQETHREGSMGPQSRKAQKHSRAPSPAWPVRSPSRPTREDRSRTPRPIWTAGQLSRPQHTPPRREGRSGLTEDAARLFTGFQEGLLSCPAINRYTASGSQLPPQSRNDENEPLPASVGQGNFMIANWAIGRDADPEQVAKKKMKMAPFGVVIITLTTAVAETMRIAKFFSYTVGSNPT